MSSRGTGLSETHRLLRLAPPAVRGFFTMPGSRPWLVLFCLLLASLIEGFGFASLLPVLALATGESEGSGLQGAIREAMATVGLEASIGPLLTVAVSAIVGKALLMILFARLVTADAARVTATVRQDLLAKILAASWTYFVSRPVGRFANAVLSEASKCAQAYTIAASFFVFLIQAAVYVGVAALVSWQIALAALLFGVLIVVLLFGFVARARRFASKQLASSIDMAVLLANVVSNIKTIKAMGRETAFLDYLASRVRRVRRTSRKQAADRQALASVQEALVAVLVAVGFYLFYSFAQVSFAELVVSALLLGRTVSSMNKVQKAHHEATQLLPVLEHLRVLSAELAAAREADDGKRPPPPLEEGIRLEQVTFCYGDTLVFDGLDLAIPAGRTTVLVGPSGAGKTTLVDLVLGLLVPQSGRILVDGVPLNELDRITWRRMIGYVPQDQVLLHASVRDNLTLGDPSVDEPAIRRALEIAEAAAFVDALPAGLDTVVGERGMRLSGGQRQRLALARALVGRPRLLVLDEVTSALDEETERRICRNIASMPDRPTILAVTHRPAWLEIADQVVDFDRLVFPRDIFTLKDAQA